MSKIRLRQGYGGQGTVLGGQPEGGLRPDVGKINCGIGKVNLF